MTPKRPRIRMTRPSVRVLDLRTAPPAPKRPDRDFGSAEHRAWRDAVIARAGRRCEWLTDGRRCERAETDGTRMFADHIVEVRDGGSPLALSNGQCLCGAHHTVKTNIERRKRMGMGV